MTMIKIAILFTFTMLFIAACGDAGSNVTTTANTQTNRLANVATPAGTPVLNDTANADDVAVGKGKEIYATNCVICHKDTGKGGKVTIKGKSINAEDLTTDKIKKMTDEKLIGYVTNGIPDEGMPAFKDKLSEEEIKAAVAHVRVLQQ
jgi:mono/diheme cytochrome c family protein